MPRLTFPFVVLALSLMAAIEVEAQPKINSPLSLVQCQPASLSWDGAQPPVYISAVQGTDISSNPLIQFPTQDSASGSLRWPAVNILSGITITLVINDGTGVNNFSGQVTIKDGSDDCSPSASPGSAGSTSNSTTTTGSTPPSSTSSGTTASSGSSSSTGSSGHTASTTSSTAPTYNSTSSSTSPSSTSSTQGSKPSTSSTSGGAGLSSTSNTVVVGAAAAMAGVLLATGLF